MWKNLISWGLLALMGCSTDPQSYVTNLGSKKAHDFGPLAFSFNGNKIIYRSAKTAAGGGYKPPAYPRSMNLNTQESDYIENSDVNLADLWGGGISYCAENEFLLQSRSIMNDDNDWRYVIFRVEIDKGRPYKITDGRLPAFSQGAQKIAFIRDPSFESDSGKPWESHMDTTGLEIYTCDIDGDNVVRLTDNDFIDSFPRFMPSLEDVRYISYRHDEIAVYEVNIQTKNERKIYRLMSGEKYRRRASWQYFFNISPDGTMVVFSNGTEITLKILATGAEFVLYHGEDPTFSPDGSQLAFTYKAPIADWKPFFVPPQLHVMDLSGWMFSMAGL